MKSGCASRDEGADDEGTIGILTLGFAVVAIMLILVISAATSVHMTRMRLADLADELAEDASDSVSSDGYFTTQPERETSSWRNRA